MVSRWRSLKIEKNTEDRVLNTKQSLKIDLSLTFFTTIVVPKIAVDVKLEHVAGIKPEARLAENAKTNERSQKSTLIILKYELSLWI